MNWRRIRKWLLLLLLVGTVAPFALAWFVGGKLIEPANRVVGPPPDDYPASSVTRQIEKFRDDHVWLSGFFFLATDSHRFTRMAQ